MNNLTNIIEAILFASGDAVPVKFITEKLQCTVKDVNHAIDELKERYNEDSGIALLVFNGKIQFATNPKYKTQVSDVLTPIKEKELSKTILECAAIIAYKQPITKSELEEIRLVSCDYAIHVLLELEMIYPCGRKDTMGKPILYGTTDNFLKRFRLNSINDLPDYNELMAQIAQLNNEMMEEDESKYLYQKDVYRPEDERTEGTEENAEGDETEQPEKAKTRVKDGFEIPDFLSDDDTDTLITID